MDDALRDELLAMRAADVTAREAIAEALRVDGASQVDQTLIDEGLRIETSNAARLAELVDSTGWPTVVQVGMEGVEAAWHIASHAESDLDRQRRFLTLMAESVEAGEPSRDRLAWLTDRVLVAEGKPQLYGTQFATSDDGLRLVEVDDPAGLAERREAVGLPPLDDQLDRLRSDLQA
jgi:hypothetical protein